MFFNLFLLPNSYFMLKACEKKVKRKSNGKLWKSLPLKLNCDLSPKLMFAQCKFSSDDRVCQHFGIGILNKFSSSFRIIIDNHVGNLLVQRCQDCKIFR